MGATAEDVRNHGGSQGFDETMGDYDMFPPEEAVTRAGGDRPTPIFHAPSQLRYFDEVMSVPPTPGGASHTSSQPYLTAVSMEPEAADELVQQAGAENEFWDSPPRYSTTSIRPLSLAPTTQARPEPTRGRRLAVKLLFAALISGVLALLTYEASVLSGVTFADVRVELTKRLAR